MTDNDLNEDLLRHREAAHRHTAFDLHQKRFLGDGVVVGFGRINGRKVAVAAQDFTVIGGSFSE